MPAASRHGRGRRVIAGVVGVIAVGLTGLAVLGLWARATVLRTDATADVVVEALDDPDARAAVADTVTDAALSVVDIDSLVTGVLPDMLDGLGQPVAAAVHQAVDRDMRAALALPAVRSMVGDLTEDAHRSALALLRGDGLPGGLAVDDGEVTFNTVPLVVRALGSVQQLGLLDDVELPEISAQTDPSDAIAELSDALGRDLPADFGQVVVYRGDAVERAETSVANAQHTVVIAQRGLWLLVALALVGLVGTVVLAPSRGRAVL
ncbi:MAG: hypothetical protein ACK5OX_12755, partial [Desertimonas sp.]